MKILFVALQAFLIAVHCKSPCDEVSFVDRAGWGALPPTSITNLTNKPFSFYVIHHSYDPPNCYDDASCNETVRIIQHAHQQGAGWADIGYHFLIGENGKVYEGRGWNRQAAHSPGWNTDAYGICIIGDFVKASPNEKALNAVHAWIKCGVELGHVKQDYYIITHRQSQRPGYTDCPGNGMMDVVNKWSRYCSYQNTDAALNRNETRITEARNFCDKQFAMPSSSATHLITPIVFFHFVFIYFL